MLITETEKKELFTAGMLAGENFYLANKDDPDPVLLHKDMDVAWEAYKAHVDH